ncbi:hypothetical protein D3C85_1016350 [compost metagenome]
MYNAITEKIAIDKYCPINLPSYPYLNTITSKIDSATFSIEEDKLNVIYLAASSLI